MSRRVMLGASNASLARRDKKAVRKAEGLDFGDIATVRVEVVVH